MKKTILILVTLILLCGCTLNTKITKEEQKDVKEEQKEKKEEQKDAVIDEKSQMGQIFTKLNSYGNELYENKKYLEYYNKEDNTYFISLNELKELNYDVSNFKNENGDECDMELSGIEFDIEEKNDMKYNGAPIVSVLTGC